MSIILLLLSSFIATQSQVCTTGTDYGIEVIFALDSTTSAVDASMFLTLFLCFYTSINLYISAEWASQVAFANSIVQKFRASTTVGVVRLSDTISSTVTKTSGNPTLSLTYSAINQRNPGITLSGIIDHGFTAGFTKQKYLIISTYGEIETGAYCSEKIRLKEQS